MKDHPTYNIILAYDLTDAGTINSQRMFYCFNCRTPVLMYSGHVAVVYPGRERQDWWLGEPFAALPLTVQCKNNDCRHRFCFLSTAAREPKGLATDSEAYEVI